MVLGIYIMAFWNETSRSLIDSYVLEKSTAFIPKLNLESMYL